MSNIKSGELEETDSAEVIRDEHGFNHGRNFCIGSGYSKRQTDKNLGKKSEQSKSYCCFPGLDIAFYLTGPDNGIFFVPLYEHKCGGGCYRQKKRYGGDPEKLRQGFS